MAVTESTVRSNLAAVERGRRVMDEITAYSKDPGETSRNRFFDELSG